MIRHPITQMPALAKVGAIMTSGSGAVIQKTPQKIVTAEERGDQQGSLSLRGIYRYSPAMSQKYGTPAS